MNRILVISLLSIVPLTSYGQTIWSVDKAHSSVQFEIDHMMVSSVTGVFRNFSGTMTDLAGDPGGGSITAEIEASSIDTGNGQRDMHLKAKDFLNTMEFPAIKFESTTIKKLEGQTYRVEGNLTLRGVTKPIVLEARYGGQVKAMGGVKAGFKARGRINRFDFGLKWNQLLEAGGAMVGETVDIVLNIELNKS